MPRMAPLPMLRSPTNTVSAPAMTQFRGSITHPTRQLCTLRGRPHDRYLTQHSLPGGSLGLTWAGLPPADRASFPGARSFCANPNTVALSGVLHVIVVR